MAVMPDDPGGDAPPAERQPPGIEDIFDGLSDLSAEATSTDIGEEVRETKALLAEAHDRGLIGSDLRQLGFDDAVQAFVGSVIFASPLLVEDGVFDIADHLFGVTVRSVPVFLLANVAFVIVMTYALIEWTGRDRVESHTVGGLPVRVPMVLIVSFLVAAVLMTVWGRAGNWQPPSEGLARVTVLWTVGSLGAALGDILAENGSPPAFATPDRTGDRGVAEGVPPKGATLADGSEREHLDDGALLAAVQERFDAIADSVDESGARRDVRRVQRWTNAALLGHGFDEGIRKYTSRDIAEGFVGSIFFSIPFLVEDGVFDVAAYFLSFRIEGFPVFFIINTAFVLAMVWVLVYWAGPRDVTVSRPLFGIIPRRMVGISVISFLTAAALMTMWGRIAWAEPVVAVARVSVVWSVASFGAALGDVLPGESSGDDINDDLDQLGDRVGDFID